MWSDGIELKRAHGAENVADMTLGNPVLPPPPALLAALEEGLDASGPTGAMRAIAEALVARSNESYVDPFEIGKTFARAGMVDEALHWLNRAAEFRSFEITYLAFRPDFDVLRGDPRFEDLLERVYGQGNPIIARP
jgi:hypothetical protein